MYRLFTGLFCHGSVSHIAINSYSLYQMGPVAERMLGKGRFVFIYLASGVLANLLTFLAGSSPFSLGASGCTFGLVGAFACHFYRNQRVLGASAQAGLQSLKQTVLINLFYGMSSPGIDNGAHIGGLVAGVLWYASVSVSASASLPVSVSMSVSVYIPLTLHTSNPALHPSLSLDIHPHSHHAHVHTHAHAHSQVLPYRSTPGAYPTGVWSRKNHGPSTAALPSYHRSPRQFQRVLPRATQG